MEKYYKNFILCGEVNYCCLLCQENFGLIYYLDKHLIWEDHKRNVKKQNYLPKFRKDFIYKIPDGRFYCEICNVIFKKVEDHIEEKTHRHLKNSKTSLKKKTPVVQFVDKLTVQISNEKITLAKWHGIRDDMCLLCNEPFGIIMSHITSYIHVVNLIQSETISENGNHYRKQGINSFYCFTCLKVYNKDDLDAHWTECHENIKKIREEKAKKLKIENMMKALKASQTDSSMTIKKIKIYFNFEEADKPVCLKCKKEVELNYDAMESHIRNHQKEKNPKSYERSITDKGKRRAELANYGRKNFIMLNRGGSMGYCTLCYVYLSAHINVAKEHVKGTLHRGHLELRGLIPEQTHEVLPYALIFQKDYIDLIRGPHTIDDTTVTCINRDICVSVESYMLFSRNYNFKNDIFKCYCCNEILSEFDLRAHTFATEHKKILCQLKVLLLPKIDDLEFVREILPNLYHCGYCHSIFPFWENLKKHLKKINHKEKRNKAKKLSEQCNEAFEKYPEFFANGLEYIKKTELDSPTKD